MTIISQVTVAGAVVYMTGEEVAAIRRYIELSGDGETHKEMYDTLGKIIAGKDWKV